MNTLELLVTGTIMSEYESGADYGTYSDVALKHKHRGCALQGSGAKRRAEACPPRARFTGAKTR